LIYFVGEFLCHSVNTQPQLTVANHKILLRSS